VSAEKLFMRLGVKDVEHASVTLARAFQEDPLMAFLIPDALKRARTLPWFLSTTVRYCLAYGEVHATPVLDAVACWLTPENTSVSPVRVFRTGGATTPLKLGMAGFRRLLAWQDYVGKEHAKHAPGPHLYLYVLGVDPLSRGRGLGRALLQPTLERADTERLPCYLETQTKNNVKVYESLGFRVMSAGKTPGYDLTTWALRREPQRTPNHLNAQEPLSKGA